MQNHLAEFKLGRIVLHLLCAALFLLLPANAEDAPGMVKREVAAHTADGEEVASFTLKNRHGLTAKVLSWGATLIELSAQLGKFRPQ